MTKKTSFEQWIDKNNEVLGKSIIELGLTSLSLTAIGRVTVLRVTYIEYGNYKPRVVKPKHKHRMTNRELAQWVAGGCGECLQNTIAFTSWNYLTENKDKTVSDGIKIRGWDETEWREPEVEE